MISLSDFYKLIYLKRIKKIGSITHTIIDNIKLALAGFKGILNAIRQDVERS
jgi:hypothetical protein